jgi:proteasome lid subunit RPN8/RPN11
MSKNKNKKNKKGIMKMTNRIFNRYNFIPAGDEQVIDSIADDGWDNTVDELKVVSTCGRKPEGPLSIIISRVANAKINVLMKKYPSCEWLAYLMGDESARYVSDLFIPTQTASSAAVTAVGAKPAGVIGVIHSHHGMGAFFSGTDDAYINQNNDISIVVTHNGIKSQVRWTTPCGYKVVSEGKVIIESENVINEDAFIGEVDKVINVSTALCVRPIDAEKEEIVNKFFTPPPKYTRGIRGLSCNTTGLLDTCKTEEEKNELKELLVNHYKRNQER